MSVSKWAYRPEKCDGDICVGDCDKCSKAMQIDEIIDEDVMPNDYCSYGERAEE